MPNIAIAGHIDGLVLSFCERLAKQEGVTLVGISWFAYAVEFFRGWRLGSQISSRDMQNCLEGIDVAYYFCMDLGPRRGEGLSGDVALMQAIHFIREAQRYPGLRVILVSRYFDASGISSECPSYKVFSEIDYLFLDSGLNLNHVRTAPVLSVLDTFTRMALLQASAWAVRFEGKRFLNLTQPITFSSFSEALIDVLKSPRAREVLVGRSVMRYGELMQSLREALKSSAYYMPRLDMLKAVPRRLKFSLLKDDATLFFEETLRLHTAQGQGECRDKGEMQKSIALMVEDSERYENKDFMPYSKAPERASAPYSRCVVQRLLYNPNRSVEEIADLLMAWLPRRLDKLLYVKRVNEQALECQILRIALFRLEKCVDDKQQSRIILSSNFMDNQELMPSFLLFSTALDDPTYGVLLILLENSPKSRFALAFERYILNDFAKYLQEFKIGTE